MAANVDVVFVVSPIDDDLSARRLDRYLTLAWESGARPVVLLTKADLVDDPSVAVAEVMSVAVGVPVHAVSVRTGAGLDAVLAELQPGATAALLGSSGVGKSTLVNTLLGEELLATQEVRSDGQGRHTTIRRELIKLPHGGLVIDTPGMRELQLWVADHGLEEAFDDVTSLFLECRFNDCSHEVEPGCAVLAALADGRLTPERWESYRTLERELAALELRLDRQAQSQARRRYRALERDARERRREKGPLGHSCRGGLSPFGNSPLAAHSVQPAFGAPGVGVVVNLQSAAASLVSCPSGRRAREPFSVFESAVVAASAVPFDEVERRATDGGRP